MWVLLINFASPKVVTSTPITSIDLAADSNPPWEELQCAGKSTIGAARPNTPRDGNIESEHGLDVFESETEGNAFKMTQNAQNNGEVGTVRIEESHIGE